MSLKRHAAKRDANEAAIVEALEKCGASVVRLSEKGCPDLLVGYLGPHCEFPGCTLHGSMRTVRLLEVKTKRGTLTADQERWRERWNGPRPITVRSVDEALQAIGVKA